MSLVNEQHVSETDTFRISRKQLKHFSRRNSILSAAHIIFEWLMIGSAIWLSYKYFGVVSYILCVIWVGSRQHALAILMHDAAHGNLFNSRRANLVLSDLFLAWPLFVSTASYWNLHSAHHRHTNTEKDPDWLSQRERFEYQHPKRIWHFSLIFLRDISGLGIARQLTTAFQLSSNKSSSSLAPKSGSRWKLSLRLSYYAMCVGIISVLGGWKVFVLYWLVPVFTWLKWALYLRAIAEHHGIPRDSNMTGTRTTYTTVLSKLLIAPKNVNYHLEHHLYPHIPFFRLRDFHKLLMNQPEYKSSAIVSQGYLNVLKEIERFGEQGSKFKTPTPIIES